MAPSDEKITFDADESQPFKTEDAEVRNEEVGSRKMPVKLVLKGPKEPGKDVKQEASGSDVGSAKVKVVDTKPRIVAGTSSETASSRLDEEPFVLASRRTVEERARKKVILKGLKDDEEGHEWVVV